MSFWIFAIPFISALIGGCFHVLCARYFLNKYLPRKKMQLAKALSNKVEAVFPLSQLEDKISNPELIEKAMPMIETHIDEFLSVKLPQEIPMLAMFVGTKTTDKIKEVFINQLRDLFPKVMNELTGDLKKTINIESAVSTEIEKVNIAAIVKESFPGGLNRFGLMGLLLGFIIGALNVFIICFFY